MAEQLSMEEEVTYCEVHPDRETALRCNRCNRLMCTQCAVRTPVGYRCRECARAHEDKFFTATTTDYVIVFAVAAGIAALGFIGVSLVRFLLFVFILAIPIGGAIGELALRLTGRRRGRYSGHVAAGGAVVGALAPGLILAGQLVLSPTVLIYAGLVAFTAYGRFRLTI
ncbi:MAG TPA: B-box zinc finger protein [Spirillospora sp.]|nr:B-box zinc finger protein [Spirillospora sp.]